MRHHGGYPAQIYPCRDGYAVLGTEPAEWDAFVDLVGDETLRNRTLLVWTAVTAAKRSTRSSSTGSGTRKKWMCTRRPKPSEWLPAI